MFCTAGKNVRQITSDKVGRDKTRNQGDNQLPWTTNWQEKMVDRALLETEKESSKDRTASDGGKSKTMAYWH